MSQFIKIIYFSPSKTFFEKFVNRSIFLPLPRFYALRIYSCVPVVHNKTRIQTLTSPCLTSKAKLVCHWSTLWTYPIYFCLYNLTHTHTNTTGWAVNEGSLLVEVCRVRQPRAIRWSDPLGFYFLPFLINLPFILGFLPASCLLPTWVVLLSFVFQNYFIHLHFFLLTYTGLSCQL